MTTITTLLTDPQNGLLPYLQTALQTRYDRFQIRPWDFRSLSGIAPSTVGGFRLRGIQSKQLQPDAAQVTRSVVVGQHITVTTNDTDAQLAASELFKDLARSIHHWSQCKAIELVREIDEFTGDTTITQDKNVASGGPLSWYCVVVCEFDMVYLED